MEKLKEGQKRLSNESRKNGHKVSEYKLQQNTGNANNSEYVAMTGLFM